MAVKNPSVRFRLFTGSGGPIGRLFGVFVDRVAVMGRELARDLIFGLGPCLGGQIAPLAVVLEFLAFIFIRKDEELVNSLDRLR